MQRIFQYGPLVHGGQGLNQRKLMTRTYWEFLVHGEELQSPIPITNGVQRASLLLALSPPSSV